MYKVIVFNQCLNIINLREKKVMLLNLLHLNIDKSKCIFFIT